jgi:glutamyl-tRNA reductase
MSLVVVGLNHKTAPIALLERLAIPEERLGKALQQLTGYEHVAEGAVLSTCNRIEVYAAVTKFHGGAQNLRNFLAEFCHIAPEDFADHLYTYHDEGAVRHLFRVAGGIDSMVVGESEILGQVRRAHKFAVDENSVGPLLGMVFRRALRVGKRARSETAIGRNPASISSAAVELARRAFEDGTLAGRTVAILGAGKMGRLAAAALRSAGATDVVILNRSEDRAREAAQQFSATPRPFEDLRQVLGTVDIVISSTTAPRTVIDRDMVTDAVSNRSPGRPLFIVDIAVPRDVDPDVGHLSEVVLRDIEDLRDVVDTTIGTRISEVSKVEEIIGAELDYFTQWERAQETVPTAAALVTKADAIRGAELERIRSHLETMTPEQRNAVTHMSRRLVAKIFHTPLSKTRDLSGPELEALRALFELDDGE